ncbi:MAG: PhoX family phosphatase [Betaproteobacteria bacterium]|nr:PhoX family phosphatase [Betaproteobacteria bacterium]
MQSDQTTTHPDKTPASDALYFDTPNLFSQILEARLSRRRILQGGLGAALTAMLPACQTLGGAPVRIGFTPISPSAEDSVRVPEGYEAQVLYRWGDPVGSAAGMPAFKPDASNTAAEQALQAGMHHDGMKFYSLDRGGAARGLLVMNHEYQDDALLHPDGTRTWSAEKTAKAQNAVGVSVIEVALTLSGSRSGWEVIRPSSFARRITAQTPCRVAGPAAGHESMKTAQDPSGTRVLGNYANCGMGWTPWGTYLACEENFQVNFHGAGTKSPEHRRYGITGNRTSGAWHAHDERFDAIRHPNEPNRFGWVVEIDPFDPRAMPVKRTAMGRLNHESAAPSMDPDGRLAFYMGDDAPFEYIYKFVTARAYDAANPAANRDLLDAGTLYAARFAADGSGEWLALEYGRNGLTPDKGFRSQADVVVKARQAADVLGATRMDRPEWCAVHPLTREVYCTLTNNSARGAPGRPGVDAANPRANNIFGQIIRWRERGGVTATRFDWDLFALGGSPTNPNPERRGRFKGDAFGSPDGLYFDARGVLWVQTDVSPSALNRGEYQPLGNNQVLAADPATGEFKRFLNGPPGCEITGLTMAPDSRTIFVNIQHPGEIGGNDPDNPRKNSNWPDFSPVGRPRSATVVVRRTDGGIIGA